MECVPNTELPNYFTMPNGSMLLYQMLLAQVGKSRNTIHRLKSIIWNDAELELTPSATDGQDGVLPKIQALRYKHKNHPFQNDNFY